MPEVDSTPFYQVAAGRWVNNLATGLKHLDVSDLDAFATDRQHMSGEQAFFDGIKTRTGGKCHLSVPLSDFDVFHIAILDQRLTGATKVHVYFRITKWQINNVGANWISLEVVEKPKMGEKEGSGGKKTTAKSHKFSSRGEVKADVERIVSVLFANCKKE